MSLSTLERRLKQRLPEETHDAVEEEFSRYETEVELMAEREEAIGQARLTDHEIDRLPMGNQHTKWNVVKWQVVKAAAFYYDVPDWTSYVDPTLTYEENVTIMSKYGTRNSEATMRDITPKIKR